VNTLAPMALAALGISFLIFIHELGHFVAARLFGVRVEIFSVGFGPRLAGFRRGETDYRLSAVPLGGYVKMAGEYGDGPTDAPPRPDELLAKPAWQRAIVFSAGVAVNFLFAFLVFPIAFHLGIPFIAPVIGSVTPGGAAWSAELRPGDEILAVSGARVYQFNDVLSGVALGDPDDLVLRVRRDGSEMDVRVHPVRNEEEGRWELGVGPTFEDKVLLTRPDGPAALAGLREGDRIVAVDGQPVASAREGREGVAELLARAARDGAAMTVTYEREGQLADARVEPAPGPTTGQQQLGVWPLSTRVAAVRKGASIPLSKDDVVLAVDGKTVATPDALRAAVEAAPAGDLELLVRRDVVVPGSAGTDTRVERRPERVVVPAAARAALLSGDVAFDFDRRGTSIVLAAGSSLAAAGLADGDTILAVDGVDVTSYDELQSRIKQSGTRFQITWRRGESGAPVTASVETRELPTFDYGLNVGVLKVLHREDLAGSIRAGIDTSLNMLRMTWLTLAKLFTGDVGTKNLGGIVQISVLSYKIADESFTELLCFLGLLSINLGFINILPIPVLDGGQLLFLLLERIKGRRLSERFLNSMQMAGLAAILLLVVWVTYQDILKLMR
jgi:regulator of sigma E protease